MNCFYSFTVSHFFYFFFLRKHHTEVELEFISVTKWVWPCQKGQSFDIPPPPFFFFPSCPYPSCTLFVMYVELPLLWGWETWRCLVQGKLLRWKKKMSSSWACPKISGVKLLRLCCRRTRCRLVYIQHHLHWHHTRLHMLMSCSVCCLQIRI